jgi:aspartate aminotransferase
MPVAKTIARQLENASWIRRMFEEGVRLKRERGADAVFDFSLGNPDVEPPPAVVDALRRIVNSNLPGSHGYMPNPGYTEVREAVAGKLRRETGLAFTAEDVFMTIGSAGACNVILKSILDPGDEVIVLMPFFPEYQFYIANHGGRMVAVETDASFLPAVERIAAAITPRTRAILLNTPNNPTGRVYPESILRDLQAVLARCGQPVTVISDEPYKSFVYDGQRQAEVASFQYRDLQLVVKVAGIAGRAHRLPGALAAPGGRRKSARSLRLQQPHAGLYQRARHLAKSDARNAG